jgi:hypothetical protein
MTIEQEPRSFAPSRQRQGKRQVKRDPLPDDPSPADLGRAIMQVEECVHETGAGLAREHTKLRKQVTRLHTRLTRIERQNAGVRHVVGVNDEGEVIRKTPLLMSRLSLVSTLGGALFAVFLVVQIGNAVFPALSLGAVELWHFIIRQ